MNKLPWKNTQRSEAISIAPNKYLAKIIWHDMYTLSGYKIANRQNIHS